VDGQTMVIGGTSAVAPLWAGLVAVANQQLGTQVGFIQPAIYAAKAAPAFNDITQGNNGAFSAAPGWDACSGLGSPIASKLIPLLAPASASVKGTAKPPARAVKKTVKRRQRSQVGRLPSWTPPSARQHMPTGRAFELSRSGCWRNRRQDRSGFWQVTHAE
jgi:kumamolisin